MSGDTRPRILALDLSLTRSGYAAADGECGLLRPPYGSKEPERRLEWIRDETAFLAGTHTRSDGRTWESHRRADLVVMEGFSFGSKGRALDQIHGLGWLVRMTLRAEGVPYVAVPPSCLKRYATGSGSAKKELVLVEAVKRLGYEGHDDNEADALWLHALAMDAYGHPVVKVPQNQRDSSVKAVTWPRLRLERAA